MLEHKAFIGYFVYFVEETNNCQTLGGPIHNSMQKSLGTYHVSVDCIGMILLYFLFQIFDRYSINPIDLNGNGNEGIL